MKLKLKPKGREKVRIRLTDEQGGQMEFESIKAAADFMGVTPFAVMYASRMGTRCRGCSVERVAKPEAK